MSNWLVLGICGVTNGGKTTLAKHCKKYLPNVTIISQDSYFLPTDSPKHVLIPELNHFNWEILSSLDMEKMYQDITDILKNNRMVDDKICKESKDILINIPLENLQLLKHKLRDVNVLVIEGFSIFNYEPIEKLCDLKFYLLLSKGNCYTRRISRVYDPPDPPGYFEKIVWPQHLEHLKEVQEKCKDNIYLSEDNKNHLMTIFDHVLRFCKDL